MLIDFKNPLARRVLFKVKDNRELRVILIVYNLISWVNTILEFIQFQQNHPIKGHEHPKLS